MFVRGGRTRRYSSHPDSLRTVKLLAKHGAQLDVVNRSGATPLLRATYRLCHTGPLYLRAALKYFT